MNAMDTAKLQEYIQHAIDLECSIITQEKIIDQFSWKWEQRRPKHESKQLISVPGESVSNRASGLFFFGTLLLVVGIILLCTSIGKVAVSSTQLIFAGGCMVGGILLFLPYYKERKSLTTYIQVACKQNEKIREENEEIRLTYEKNLSAWNKQKTEVSGLMQRNLLETQTALKNLYNLDYIYPKYRNLTALTSIYEYFATGRCSELTGPHGAYNLYEDEVRKDMIIAQLNTVIENLEQIKQNQYKLYQQVQGILRNTQAVTAELYALTGYAAALTAVNTFYNGVSAMNSNALLYCRSLSSGN